ncbi:hypothetical protein [Vibrio vulnificus]|uniref:hypothetical protein n=1 Tax=Vibrio vulnificus TaxID=672 RepID=UPI00188A89E7|nr:hypothetical protein [Vibrio vulnificus]MBF4453486.1 hypothetical protein [Vibrio vulnificus]MBF4499513.1 hypothetical protein [Vibrio vulnificus]MBL6178971.1 hypothetical protein [Vibrio vulnificus]HDY7983833.1 hypothetical protein [Vibrio vulnificus]HDY8007301.1 hypothetical protein [Vibrio vulnificus]
MNQIAKYIIGILLIFGVSEVMAQKESRIDVNQAVENPALVAAMDRVAREGSDAAKDELLKQLLQANYLAAVFTDGLKLSSDDSNQRTLEKVVLLVFYLPKVRAKITWFYSQTGML